MLKKMVSYLSKKKQMVHDGGTDKNVPYGQLGRPG